jgi:type VI secretion system protein ImpL
MQIYQEQLSYLRDALSVYQDDPASADSLLSRLASARTRVRSLIETQQVGWRPRFDALLWPPVNGSSVSSTSALAGEKGQQWCSSVVLPFGRTLQQHYPFSKQGQDAALADLADFYRPGSGILWGFYEAALKRDVVQMGGRFERKQGAGGAMYTAELVRFLDRSAYLSSVLFPPRETKPRVDFEVRVRPSPGIAQVLLSVDGQLVDFHNGPERWFHMTWPGEGDKREATMRIKGDRIDETLVQEGEWGLFRLLDKGTLSASPGDRFFTTRFRLHTQNDVTIDIRPARTENPFVGLGAYLQAFRAPGVEAPRSIATRQKVCVP